MRAFLLLLLLTCGEKTTDYAVQHDVGRLCVAWASCDAVHCDAYANERGRMMSTWGRRHQQDLASNKENAVAELATMASASGADSMSPTCRRLVDSRP